jgi:hypothetical protein
MPYGLTMEMLIFLLKAFQNFPSVFGGHLYIQEQHPLHPEKRVQILGLLLKSGREIVPTH